MNEHSKWIIQTLTEALEFAQSDGELAELLHDPRGVAEFVEGWLHGADLDLIQKPTEVSTPLSDEHIRQQLDARGRYRAKIRQEAAEELRSRFLYGAKNAWSAGWLSAASHLVGEDPVDAPSMIEREADLSEQLDRERSYRTMGGTPKPSTPVWRNVTDATPGPGEQEPIL